MVSMESDIQLYWKERLREWSHELGFVGIGFTQADLLEDLTQVLQARFDKGIATPFEDKNIQKRINPQEVWRECQTVAALAYPLPLAKPSNEGQGVLARSAAGKDYHRVLNAKLRTLVEKMQESGWPGTVQWQVDTGPLVERAFAVRAGLGWLGRSQQLIIPGFGSFVALALLLLDQKIRPDSPLNNQCGNCKLCTEACPAQIIGKEPFAAKHCVSYLTQSKEILSNEEQKQLGTRIFGCDTCQEVCPHNQKRINEEKADASKVFLQRGVDLFETLNLTKGEFQKKYQETAAGWRGKAVLQRNAFLALRNQQDERLKPWLEERLKSKTIPPIIVPYLD